MARQTGSGLSPARGPDAVSADARTADTFTADTFTADALTVDGRIVRLRPVGPGDADALRDLHRAISDDSLYLRFFGLSRSAAMDYVDRLVTPQDGRLTVAAWLADRLVAVASCERTDASTAEVALLVADDCHRLGIGTLMLEHLAARARAHGLRRFTAEILAQNELALRTLRDLGLGMSTTWESGTALVEMDLRPDDDTIRSVDRRGWSAERASVRHLLAPASVAVIGAGLDPTAVGHQVLRNLIDGGFTGSLVAVNPHHDAVLGVPCVPSPAQLPCGIDLAIVAIPAAGVLDVVRGCGARHTRAMVILTAGFGEAGAAGRSRQDEILAAARQDGMRLVGPNCLGLINTDPAVRLNATFTDLPVPAGPLGLVSQSGALGIGVLDAAGRAGPGVAQFVSIGNRADVSSNDLLAAWADEDRIRVVALYLESVGNPRTFARVARRVADRKPVIAIKSGRSAAGRRAGRSHTAAAATGDVVIDALFRQAGVLRVDTMEQMLDAARVLCDQPVPSGCRLAVVGNSGGPQILAADAASAAGLEVVELAPGTRRALRQVVPDAASADNPVDLGSAATPVQVGDALSVLLAADEVDAILAVVTRTAVTDLPAVLDRIAAAAGGDKPVVACCVGETAESVRVPGAADRRLPVFGFPEPAAAALAVAARYGRIRSADGPGHPARPAGIDREQAAAIVTGALAAGAGWLTAAEVERLLAAYGLPTCPQRPATGVAQALIAAGELGYPVVVKLADPGLHKTDVGGVRLGLVDERALRAAVADLTGGRPRALLLQPMVPPGLEFIVGAVQHDHFGAVLMVGAGGVFTDLVADRAFRLAPVGPGDAAAMLDELRMAPMLDGYRGAPAVSRERLADLLIRVGSVVEDLGEVAELDLNPVIGRGTELMIVDARIRVAAVPPRPDPLVRRLPL